MATRVATRRWAAVPVFALALVATATAAGRSAAGPEWGSWTAVQIGTADLRDVSAVDDRVWAVGAAGTVLASRDAGATWTAQPPAAPVDLHAVRFVDAAVGWAVGTGDTVLATRDGGRRWARTATGARRGSVLRDVDFVDQTHGWVVGHTAFPLVGNVAAATRDGGATWTRLTVPLGVGLRTVSFADRRHGFAGGFLGVAYRTEDGGATWIPMPIDGMVADVGAVLRVDDRRGLAAVHRTIYRTDDGGLTWAPVAEADQVVRGLGRADAPDGSGHVAVAVGDGGLVLRSEDDGWSWVTQPAGTPAALAGVTVASPAAAVAVGGAGTVATYDPAGGARPLDVRADPETCGDRVDDAPGGRLAARWSHPAAGYQVAAARGDLTGDGAHEIVVTGPEGVRAVRPGLPTASATLWERPFQARGARVVLADVAGDDRPDVVVAAAAERGSRSGVVVLDGRDGQVRWSRRLSGGAAVVRTADLGAGRHDVVVVTGGNALHVLSGADGRDLRPPRALGARPRHLQVGDLGGGGPDAVVALADGRAVAVDLRRDRVRWTYAVQQGTLEAVALADVTGDGRRDAVLGGRGIPTALTSPNHSGTLAVGERRGPLVAVVRGDTGRRAWDWAVPAGGDERVVAVSAGDVSGDGRADVVAHVAALGDGRLVALDGRGAVAGEPDLLWTADTTHGIGGVQGAYTPEGLVVGDGDGDGVDEVYVSSWSGALVGVDALGRAAGGSLAGPPPQAERLFTVARRPPHTHVSLPADATPPALVTASGDHLVALRDPSTGQARWRYDAGGSPAIAVGALTASGGPGVAVGSAAGRVYGLDGAGALLRADRDAFLPGDTAGVAAADVTGDGRDEVVAASASGTVAAFDPRTNARLWQTSVGAGAGPVTAVGRRLVAVGTADGRVVALDAGTGRVVWEQAGAAAVRALATAPDRGLIAAGDAAGVVRLLDPAGALQAQTPVDPAEVAAVAAADLDGDGLEEFAVAAGRTLQGLGPRGERRWRSVLADSVAAAAAGDLTGDGAADVVGTATDGRAYAVDGRAGTWLWSIPNGWPGPVAVADLDGNGRKVAVVTSPAAPGAPPGEEHTVRTVGADGRIISRCTTRKAPHVAGVRDLDADGREEVVVGMRQGDVYLFGARALPAPPPEESTRAPDAPPRERPEDLDAGTPVPPVVPLPPLPPPAPDLPAPPSSDLPAPEVLDLRRIHGKP